MEKIDNLTRERVFDKNDENLANAEVDFANLLSLKRLLDALSGYPALDRSTFLDLLNAVETEIDGLLHDTTSGDSVNHPSHYTAGKLETIDVIEDSMTPEAFRGYCMGNVLKYLIRHEHKGGVEDLRKGAWYLNRLIASEGGDAS